MPGFELEEVLRTFFSEPRRKNDRENPVQLSGIVEVDRTFR